MSLIVPIHVMLCVIFLQALCITSLPEDAFLNYPLQNEEEYVLLDSRGDPGYVAASAIKQGETRRRSILDKNFARFGRSGSLHLARPRMIALSNDPDAKNIVFVNDDDMDTESFDRNARSGERSDQFIRFGRGRSNFVRFGRAESDYGRNRNFIRFGRSVRSVKNTKGKQPMVNNEMAYGMERRKRSADSNNLDYYKKGGSNFVRFGRARSENFMRFGRMMNENYPLGSQNTNFEGDLANPEIANLDAGPNPGKSCNNTCNLKKHREEMQGHRGYELLLRMLMELLTQSHQQTPENNQQNPKQEINRCT